MLCIFNTFTSKYFHFAHVILTMLSSTYHFWGVHNLYQAKSAKLNIGEQSEVGLFFFFRLCFSFIFFRYSFFAFRYSISLFVFHFWSFTFCIRFSFFIFLTFKIGPSIVFWHSNWGRIYYFYIQNPILTFKLGPKIVFWHSKSYFDIRAETEYRVWHSKSYFGIQNLAEYIFWHSKSHFDIRTGAEYRILTLKILFWHSKYGWISNFDIQNPILTFELGPNIAVGIQNPILTFELRLNIVFQHSKSYFDIGKGAVYRILTFLSKSYFHIRIEAEYRIVTFIILFWHSKLGRISQFDIQNPISTFEIGRNIVFWHSKSYFNLGTGPNVVFWHSKPYFDIRNLGEYRILTVEILFWHWNLGRISYFDLQTGAEYRIFTCKILFWHSKWGRISYFDIKIKFWHSKWGRIPYFDIQNPILTSEIGLNIVFWH